MSGDQISLQQMQEAVHDWISQWDEGYFHPLSNFARLAEEVGELGRELNHRFGDKPKKPGDATAELSEELGDILFVVVALANQLDVDLTNSFKETLKKYDVRDGERFTPKKGDSA